MQKQLKGLHRQCCLQPRRLAFLRPHFGTRLLLSDLAILRHMAWPQTPRQPKSLKSTAITMILQACEPLALYSQRAAIGSQAGMCHLSLLKGSGTANQAGNSLHSMLQGKACPAGTPAQSSLPTTCRVSRCSQQIMQVSWSNSLFALQCKVGFANTSTAVNPHSCFAGTSTSRPQAGNQPVAVRSSQPVLQDAAAVVQVNLV